jgi:hypothetical protein
VFTDTRPELHKAVRRFDLAAMSKGGDLDERRKLLKELLSLVSVPRDSLVLWHLLLDADSVVRTAAEDHLRDLVEPPPGKQESFTAEEWLAHLRLAAWQPKSK